MYMKHMNITQFNSQAKTNIIDENKFDENDNIKKFNYFNYDALSKRFMKLLLDKMLKYFGNSLFKSTKK